MKLKKTAEPEMLAPAPATGGAVIADRYKLDVPESNGPAGVGRTSAMIALICSLVSIAMLGVVAWLMYMNWELIRDV